MILLQGGLLIRSLTSILSPLWNSLFSVINPLTPKISLVILLTVYHTVLVELVGRIGIRSIHNPLIDIFLYSHHLSA